jgi:hypothetical protein
MWTIMYWSFSSTFVTVWAFNPNCFLINVSTSTSIRSFRGCHYKPSKDLMNRGFTPAAQPPSYCIENPSTSIALFGEEAKYVSWSSIN